MCIIICAVCRSGYWVSDRISCVLSWWLQAAVNFTFHNMLFVQRWSLPTPILENICSDGRWLTRCFIWLCSLSINVARRNIAFKPIIIFWRLSRHKNGILTATIRMCTVRIVHDDRQAAFFVRYSNRSAIRLHKKNVHCTSYTHLKYGCMMVSETSLTKMCPVMPQMMSWTLLQVLQRSLSLVLRWLICVFELVREWPSQPIVAGK